MGPYIKLFRGPLPQMGPQKIQLGKMGRGEVVTYKFNFIY